MTDTDVASPEGKSSFVEVMITKAKKAIKVNMGSEFISNEMFDEIIYRGLSDILNSGMSKITIKDLEGDQLTAAQDAAFAKAAENLKALEASEIKAKGSRGKSKAVKLPAEVKTEALRLAKALVKDQIKADGEKISHYKASDITKWAKQILEADDSLYELAKSEIEKRKATPIKISLGKLTPDAGLVKKAEAAAAKKKAEKKQTLSATQAGIPARQKPKGKSGQATAH